MLVGDQLVQLKSMPTHGTKPEDLNPNKLRQRSHAAGYLAKHGTILELYAGAGNLSERVYARLNPARMVLVDDDAESIAQAKSRLRTVSARKEFFVVNNEQFIKKGGLRRYPDLTLVDFDAYGAPGRLIRLFFENYRVRQPMIVALTDGFPVDVRPWKGMDFGEIYSLKQARPPSLAQICGFHDTMMKNLGSRGRFKSWRINRAFGGRGGRAVYAAYLVQPLGTRSRSFRPG